MMRLLASALTIAAVSTACTSGPPPPVSDLPYGETIEALRVEKDAFFLLGDKSPLLPEDQAVFAGLPYYPIESTMRVPAVLTEEPRGTPVIIELPTSAIELRRMRKVGTLGFSLGDVTYRLTAFTDENDRTMARLFVPFGDLTSGTETYGGGRYLELDRTPTGLYDLDFNRAYHPYCVFNISYVCPVPPRENRLAVAIRAGERLAPDRR
jgi:uncharacterized protein (DUF1684 family)